MRLTVQPAGIRQDQEGLALVDRGLPRDPAGATLSADSRAELCGRPLSLADSYVVQGFACAVRDSDFWRPSMSEDLGQITLSDRDTVL